MQKQKGFIIITVTVVLLAVMLCWISGTAPVVSAGTAEQERLIRVYGEAELSAAPDRAHIVLGVETRSETAQEAAGENARIMANIMDELKKAGLQEEQIETGTYQLHSQRENIEPDRNLKENYIYTYRASNTINITLEELEDTGSVIDTAVRAGANQVQSLRFELRDAESLKMQALQDATVQAGAKAEAIAESAGITIKGIKSISEDMTSYTPFRARAMPEMLSDDAAEMTTPVMPGDVKVQARITAEYYF